MFKNLPKKITLAIFLIKSLDLPIGLKLMQELLYLWREFLIKVSITPTIKEYTIAFYYKDNQLVQFKTTNLKDIIKVSQTIKESRCD